MKNFLSVFEIKQGQLSGCPFQYCTFICSSIDTFAVLMACKYRAQSASRLQDRCGPRFIMGSLRQTAYRSSEGREKSKTMFAWRTGKMTGLPGAVSSYRIGGNCSEFYNPSISFNAIITFKVSGYLAISYRSFGTMSDRQKGHFKSVISKELFS